MEDTDVNCCVIPNIIPCNGYNVCTSCGQVISRVISYTEGRNFFLDDKVNSTNTEPVRNQIGPRTVIKGNLDGKGNYLTPKSSFAFDRLAKRNRSLITGFERNLWTALPKFNQLVSQLNLPNYIAEEALQIYKSAAKLKLTLGRTIEGIITVSIYCALKIHGLPRTIEEVLSASQISRKVFMYCYKAIINEILPKKNLKVSNFTPQDYIHKFYDELNLSMKCRNLAVNAINQCQRKGLKVSGKDPKGFAAALLYHFSKLNDEFRTQKQVCKVANISEITLRMRLKEISNLV